MYASKSKERRQTGVVSFGVGRSARTLSGCRAVLHVVGTKYSVSGAPDGGVYK